MRNPARVIAALVTAAAVAAPITAHAGWESWYKPDIVAAQVVPSSTSPYHVKVIIGNTKAVSTGGFWLMVKAHTASSSYKFVYVGGLSAYDAMSVDVDLGTYVHSPGLVIEARADLFNQVKETNESNNVAYHIAPPW